MAARFPGVSVTRGKDIARTSASSASRGRHRCEAYLPRRGRRARLGGAARAPTQEALHVVTRPTSACGFVSCKCCPSNSNADGGSGRFVPGARSSKVGEPSSGAKARPSYYLHFDCRFADEYGGPSSSKGAGGLIWSRLTAVQRRGNQEQNVKTTSRPRRSPQPLPAVALCRPRTRPQSDRNGVESPPPKEPAERRIEESDENLPLSRRAVSLLAAAAATWSATHARGKQSPYSEQWVGSLPRAGGAAVAYPTPRTQPRSSCRQPISHPQTPIRSFGASSALQPEFNEQLGKYLNRRATTGASPTAREGEGIQRRSLPAFEKDYGSTAGSCWAWGIESAFGRYGRAEEPHGARSSRVVALAWPELRRRAYWEQELLNVTSHHRARWSTPEGDARTPGRAPWATQGMPEVWLNVGLGRDETGGPALRQAPGDDALAGRRNTLPSSEASIRPGEHSGIRSARGGGGASGGMAVTNLRNAGRRPG